MKYEKPDLEELELVLEGSFLDSGTTKPGNPDEGDKDDGEFGGEEDIA